MRELDKTDPEPILPKELPEGAASTESSRADATQLTSSKPPSSGQGFSRPRVMRRCNATAPSATPNGSGSGLLVPSRRAPC